VLAAILVLGDLTLADTIYMKDGDVLEDVTLTEVTQADIRYRIGERAVVYTISKNDVWRIVYDDGSEDVFEALELSQGRNQSAETMQSPATIKDTANHIISIGYSGIGFNTLFHTSWIYPSSTDDRMFSTVSVGGGLAVNGILASSFNYQFGMALSGTPSTITFGTGLRLSFTRIEIPFYIGYLYKQWAANIGYSIGPGSENNSFVFNAEYMYEHIREKAVKQPKRSAVSEQAQSRPRYFRLGLELNYPVWRDSIDFFENKFPYMAAGAGLFFRIGPDKIYFTTGVYAKIDVLERHDTRDLSIWGIPLATLPLMDIYWSRVLAEVPLFLNFGSGQIRFTGGALLDFYVVSQFDIDVLDNRVLSTNDIRTIEERFGEIPAGNMYWALGLDFDIVKYWGIGVKFLILNHSFGEPDGNGYYTGSGSASSSRFRPSALQTRVSTYFVF
jgi:hypothetical protein